MAIRVRDHLFSIFGDLRFEPVDKRVRGRLGPATVFDTTHAVLIWEPGRIVPQYAVPITDIAADLAFDNCPCATTCPRPTSTSTVLEPSATTTACAYKGVAAYRSYAGEPDLVWTYPAPLPDAQELVGLFCFFTERVDLVLDGERPARPASEWSPPNRQP